MMSDLDVIDHIRRRQSLMESQKLNHIYRSVSSLLFVGLDVGFVVSKPSVLSVNTREST